MTAPWSRVELLNDSHDIAGFQCGLGPVDEWFQDKAKVATRESRIATHVCVDDAGAVQAFYAMKQIIVSVEGASRVMRDTAECDGETTGMLLAQMGVSKAHQGQGLGKQLITIAMQTAVQNHQNAPFRLLVVDAATPSLVEFYQRFQFRLLRENERRLVMKMSLARKLVEELVTAPAPEVP